MNRPLTIFSPWHVGKEIGDAVRERRLLGDSPTYASQIRETQERIRFTALCIALQTCLYGLVAPSVFSKAYNFLFPEKGDHPAATHRKSDFYPYGMKQAETVEIGRKAMKEKDPATRRELLKRALVSMNAQNRHLVEVVEPAWRHAMTKWLEEFISDKDSHIRKCFDFFLEHGRPLAYGRDGKQFGIILGSGDFSYGTLDPEKAPRDESPRQRWFRENRIPFYDSEQSTLYFPGGSKTELKDDSSVLGHSFDLIWFALHDAFYHKTSGDIDFSNTGAVIDLQKFAPENDLILLIETINAEPQPLSLATVIRELRSAAGRSLVKLFAMPELQDMKPSKSTMEKIRAGTIYRFIRFLIPNTSAGMFPLFKHHLEILAREPNLITQ